MTGRVWGWLVNALLTRQTWALELYLAVQSLTWGVWLLAPWSAFGQVPDAFTVLGLIPEEVWGVIFASHGGVHLYVIWMRDVGLCRRAVLALAALWLVVLVSLLLTIPLATSTPIYASSVLACLWVYLRLHWRFG